MTGRWTLLFALPLILPLASCGATDIPAPNTTTVTVWVDPTGPAAPQTPTEPPSETASTPPQAIPTRLSAGHGRGAVGSYSKAMARIDAADDDRDARAFISPSGNIFCALAAVQASCEVAAGRVPAPQPGICAPDGPQDIGRIELTVQGATPVCNSDSIRTKAAKIGYETVARGPGGSIECLMEETGVTCVDHVARHGFFLARGAFETF